MPEIEINAKGSIKDGYEVILQAPQDITVHEVLTILELQYNRLTDLFNERAGEYCAENKLKFTDEGAEKFIKTFLLKDLQPK